MLERLKKAGFSDNEINVWKKSKVGILVQAGFSQKEIQAWQTKTQDSGFEVPATMKAEKMVSKFYGLDRQPKPKAPFIERHPSIGAAGKVLWDIPDYLDEMGTEIVGGASWGLTDRAAEFGDYLSRKIFGEGRKGGATGTWEEDESKLPGYMKKGSRFVGEAMAISSTGKVIAAPLIKVAQKSKWLAPFKSMIGWGAAGTAYTTATKLVEEGEMPTAGEAAKHGAMWAAVDGAISACGWSGKLALGVTRLSKTWGIPKKEVLKIILKEAKVRDMPLARYIYTKAKVQKALKGKNKEVADAVMGTVKKTMEPFKKRGTYTDLVTQLKKQEIGSRVQSFKKHVSEQVVSKKAKDIQRGYKYRPMLTEEMPGWVRDIGFDIRYNKPVSKEKLAKYVEYWKTVKNRKPIGEAQKVYDWSGKGTPREIKTPPLIKTPKTTEHVQDAALVMQDGKIIKGQSHLQAYEKAMGQGYSEAAMENIKEGFVTNEGRYISRAGANELHGLSQSEALVEKGIISSPGETTLGFGPTAQLQKIYEKLMSRLSHKKAVPETEIKIVEPVITEPCKHIMKALKTCKPLQKKQKEIYIKGRAEKMQKALKVGEKTSGEIGFYAQKRALAGEMKKVQFTSIRPKITQEQVDALFEQIKNSPVLNDWEKFPAGEALATILGKHGGRVPPVKQLEYLGEVFGSEFVSILRKNLPLLKKIGNVTYNVASMSKSIMSSYDLSGMLRQAVFFVGRPVQMTKAFGNMIKCMCSEKAYLGVMNDIRNMKTFDLMQEHGLALTARKGMSGREELFMSTYAEKLPVVGIGVRGASRAHTGGLNKLRAEVFEDLASRGQGLGITDPVFYRDLAHFINNATGRGGLGTLEGSAMALNAFFFSPRLISSRLTLMNPMFYVNLHPKVRREALKSLFSFGAVALSVAGAAKLGGMEVENDPRNADFMKPKIGNTRYDILGGFQQPIRLASQVISGKIISSTTGKTLTLGEGYKPITRLGIASRFLEYKEAPVFSLATALLRGQTALGGKVDIPTELAVRFTPMVSQDVLDLYNDKGIEGIPLSVPAFLGVGVQTYGGVESYGVHGKDYPALNKELSRLKIPMGFPSTSAYGETLTKTEYDKFKKQAGLEMARALTIEIGKTYYKESVPERQKNIIAFKIDQIKKKVKWELFRDKKQVQDVARGARKGLLLDRRDARKYAKEQIKAWGGTQ